MTALKGANEQHYVRWAMAYLGYFHQAGIGGPVDRASAKSWYEKAIAAGNESSIVRNNLANLTSPPAGPSRASRQGQARQQTGSRERSEPAHEIYQPPPPHRTIIYECYGCNSLREF